MGLAGWVSPTNKQTTQIQRSENASSAASAVEGINSFSATLIKTFQLWTIRMTTFTASLCAIYCTLLYTSAVMAG